MVRDPAQNFTELVNRLSIIDFAVAQQGAHYRSAPGSSIQTRKQTLFTLLLYRLHEIPDQAVAWMTSAQNEIAEPD